MTPRTEFIRWKGRDATRLKNSLVEMTVLTGGGHLAEFRFLEQEGVSSANVLWEAPWDTFDPNQDLVREHESTGADKFLAGFTGHALCLDYFGPPSAAEAEAGLALHGEVASTSWNVVSPMNSGAAACRWSVELPRAQLMFERKIRLGKDESVALVEESVRSERETGHCFHWVHHATFGLPFLVEDESTFSVSADRGITSPTGYDGRSLFLNDREFTWPFVQCEGAGLVDLKRPFSTKGFGFLAAVQLDRQRKVEYLLAMNWRLRLGVGYCFLQKDFPWMTLWEENCARQNSPWNGRSQVRGMEFGTTPFPLGREESFRRGPLFDAPSWCMIPPYGSKAVRYLIFLFKIPSEIGAVESAEVLDDTIVLHDSDARLSFSIPSDGAREFILGNERKPNIHH